MYTPCNSANSAVRSPTVCCNAGIVLKRLKEVHTHKKAYSGSGGAVPRTTPRLFSVGQVIVEETLLRHRRYGDVPARFCTGTVMYRQGFVSVRLCTGTVMHWYGYVPARLCTGMVMYRQGFVPVRLCTGNVLYRYGYAPARLCTGTVMYRHGYVPVCDSSPHHVVRPEGIHSSNCTCDK